MYLMPQLQSISLFFFFFPINPSGGAHKFLSSRLDESKAHGHIGFVVVFFFVWWGFFLCFLAFPLGRKDRLSVIQHETTATQICKRG